MSKICKKYAQDLPKICQRYAKDIPDVGITDLLSNMDHLTHIESRQVYYNKKNIVHYMKLK